MGRAGVEAGDGDGISGSSDEFEKVLRKETAMETFRAVGEEVTGG
jgi:hypothetical protein